MEMEETERRRKPTWCLLRCGWRVKGLNGCVEFAWVHIILAIMEFYMEFTIMEFTIMEFTIMEFTWSLLPRFKRRRTEWERGGERLILLFSLSSISLGWEISWNQIELDFTFVDAPRLDGRKERSERNREFKSLLFSFSRWNFGVDEKFSLEQKKM